MSGPTWRMLPLGLLAAAARAQQMPALVATGPQKYSVASVRQPALGDLRRKFANLPASCEVLLHVNASSVNPADTTAAGPFPQVMGSDVAATVAEVEPNCSRLRPGDRVWADIGAVVLSRGSGARGKESGAFAPVAVALETQLGPMPKNLDFAEAASLPKVALTSYKALAWYGGAPYVGEARTVLVLGGSGGCGTTGLQLAKAFGAATVVTTTSAANAEYVRGLGADVVIDYATANWWEVLRDGSVDVIYDTVGQRGTGDRAMPKLRSGGYYVTIVGSMPSAPRQDVHAKMFINSETNLDNLPQLEALRELVEQDKLRMRDLTPYPLPRILDAFANSSTGHVRGKLVIQMPPVAVDPVQVELRV